MLSPITIDDNFLQQVRNSDPYNAVALFTGGGTQIGAQNLQAAQTKGAELTEFINKKFSQAQKELAAINPALDPTKYLIDTASAVDFGGGATANRGASIQRPFMSAQDKLLAIDLAQKAAQKYQQTGQVDPYPTSQQILQQSSWAKYYPQAVNDQNFQKKVAGNISVQDKQTANAAAARVGSTLPYPDQGVGQIAAGGLFTNADFQQPGFDYNKEAANRNAGIFSQPNKQPTQQQLSPLAQQIKDQLDKGVSQTGQALTPQNIENLKKQFLSVTGQNYAPGSVGTTNGGTAASTNLTPQSGNTPGTVNAGNVFQDKGSIDAALAIIDQSNLDDATKAIYRDAVKNWNPGDEVNTPNILKTFADIRSKTIDPQFKQMADIATDEVKRAHAFSENERQRELETEGLSAKQSIGNSQNDLEARGMTFSGQGVEQLGAKSAYAQPGTPEAQQSAIPTQTMPFGGKYAEGLVNASNRLISSSSQARYQKGLEDLSRQAEQTLGSAKSSGLVPGIKQMGNIVGSQELQKQGTEASTLGNLYSQEKQNYQAKQPLNLFQS